MKVIVKYCFYANLNVTYFRCAAKKIVRFNTLKFML